MAEEVAALIHKMKMKLRPQADEEVRRDMSRRFNTRIPAKHQDDYTQWIDTRAEAAGRSPDNLRKDIWDYDIQGAFIESGGDPKYGLAAHEASGTTHGSSDWKKPSHPTFSSQSHHHLPNRRSREGGAFVERDGKNYFVAGPANRKYWSEAALRAYFEEQEPDVELIYKEQP